jgi:hypothetical protein
MSIAGKLALCDVTIILVAWATSLSLSGSPNEFLDETIFGLIYVCVAVVWRVYSRISRFKCLRLYHAILDGSVTGALLGVLRIGYLFNSYAFAAGVWWNGSDGSDVTNGWLWVSQLGELTVLTSIGGILVGMFFWFFNGVLLLFPFYRSGIEAKL